MQAAGRPYPGVDVKVIDANGRPLPAGDVGEICIRTPAAMLGYWRSPEATAQTLIDGWIHTGDAGRLDEEGYVFVCDRIKDTIIVAGENVYPGRDRKCPEPAPGRQGGGRGRRAGRALGRGGPRRRCPRAGPGASPRALMLSILSSLPTSRSPPVTSSWLSCHAIPAARFCAATCATSSGAHMSRQVN